MWVKNRTAADQVSHKSTRVRNANPLYRQLCTCIRNLVANQLTSSDHRLEHCKSGKAQGRFATVIVICPMIRDVAGAQITGRIVGTDANYRFLDFLLRSPTNTGRVELKRPAQNATCNTFGRRIVLILVQAAAWCVDSNLRAAQVTSEDFLTYRALP